MQQNKKTIFVITHVFIPFMTAYFLSELFRNINGIVGPRIEQALALSAKELGLMTSLFLIAIAGSQLIVGVYLDRYGARRTVSCLLLIGAVGAFLFASGQFLWMSIGRFLLGIGMAGCWTAAFKVNAQWWPANRLAFANGAIIGFAGMGALTATLPTHYILTFISWQTLFYGLSALTILVSLYLYFMAPDHPDDKAQIKNMPEKQNMLEEFGGFLVILRNPVFIAIGPLSIICQGAWLSYQGLWAGAWLRQVEGLSSNSTAFFLLLLAIFVVLGNFILGALADKLTQKGIARSHICLLICLLYVLVQLLIVMNIVAFSPYLWAIFGFFVSGSILAYAILSHALPIHMAGRAVSLLNLFATLAGFLIQYGVGYILNLWPAIAIGEYPSIAHQRAFLLVIIIQMLALIWGYYKNATSPNQAT